MRFQIARKLGARLGEPLHLELGEQDAQVAAAAAARAQHGGVAEAEAAAVAAGAPALPGLPLVRISPQGQREDGSFVGRAVRGCQLFDCPESAGGNLVLLSQSDLLAVVYEIEEGGRSAGDCWMDMLEQLESSGINVLDTFIDVS